MTRIKQLKELNEDLPDSDKILSYDLCMERWKANSRFLRVPEEALITFGDTPEQALDKLIRCLDQSVTVDSTIGTQIHVTGWPDIPQVRDFLDLEAAP